ncbi:hypothetical protein ACIGZJ_21460 [Kitasatospora sp. NPDC052868]|uniref:hypothetical protein n=1 Tax=Kitasatospora sp. NPDC052868 TaxID=3364060 RepID=UPI0037C74611
MTAVPSRPTAVRFIEQPPRPELRTAGALHGFTPSISTPRLLAEGKGLPNHPFGP